MFKSKYSTFLTVFLIILIISILIIATIFAVKTYKNYQEDKQRERAIADFQETAFEENEEEETKEEENEENDDNNEVIPIITPEIDQQGSSSTNETPGTNTGSNTKTKFYYGYPMIGTIKISKTNIEYPILSDVSPGALEKAVGVMYPSNPQLNEASLTVIIGHNYKNGKLFSNNKKLVVGDTIKITNLSGKTLTYVIYEIMTISSTDTSYISKDRGNNIEIALSTCTDDGKERLVILARAQ